MSIGTYHYVFIGAILFYLSLLGMIINRKSLIHLLVCLELLLLAVNINFVAFSSAFLGIRGQIFTVFILTISAAEIAIGLSIIVVYFRNRGSILVDDATTLVDDATTLVDDAPKGKGSIHDIS